MKSSGGVKASKASLLARGLPTKTKPPAFKRVSKGQHKAVKETKPGYSLYTSDSEDQVSSVDRGLNRCAALLSNILDNEDKGKQVLQLSEQFFQKVDSDHSLGGKDGTAKSKVTSMGKPVKSTLKRAGTALHPQVKPDRLGNQRARPSSRKVLIPTAKTDDRASPSPSRPQEVKQGISTAYNDRLVSSTPILTAEERQKQQQLQRREAELQQELSQLKQRYELLQKQNDPNHHTEQKLQLQNSMMQELDSHQRKNPLQRSASSRHSTERQSVSNSGSEKHSRRPSARKSLDYSGFPEVKTSASDTSVDRGFDKPHVEGVLDATGGEGRERVGDDDLLQSVDDSVTQEVDTSGSKKQVRIISPSGNTSPHVDRESLASANPLQNMSNSTNTGISEGKATRQIATPSSPSARASSRRAKDGIEISSAENQARMIEYLIDELRALLGNTGDLEVDRLLSEIDNAAKLLPYLLEKDHTASVSQETEQAVRAYKVENAQLKRKLLISHQKLKEGSIKKYDDKSSGRTDLAFELAACRSVNSVLQKQLSEEKDSKEQVLTERDRLSQNLNELKEERKKFLQILSNKEQDNLRLKRELQQDSSKLTAENDKLKADLEAVYLSTEADKKEATILGLSLKQKDAEIDRLKELTRGLQQSLTRLLSDIEQFQPNGPLKLGSMLDKASALEGLNKFLGSGLQTAGQVTTPGLSPEVLHLARRSNRNPLSPSQPEKTLITTEQSPPLSQGVVSMGKVSGRSSDLKYKKHLRFADAAQDTSVHTDGIESWENGLKVEDLEDEENGGDLSSLSSGEEEDFKRDLANLDANIARIQKSLRETAHRT